MIHFAFALSALLLAGAARAGIPTLNFTCPGDIEVHADEGGPVYFNGKEAKLKKFNENYFEATDSAAGVTASISMNPDGSPSVSYTGKHGAKGVCQNAASGAGTTDAKGVGEAKSASSGGLALHCRGSGTVDKTETAVVATPSDDKPKTTTVQTKTKHDIHGSVDVQVGTGTARIRVPKEMVPPINSVDGESWAAIDEFSMTDEKITGKAHISFVVKPHVTIHRQTGEILIEGSGRSFDGDCEKVAEDAKPKF
jgi:hypothetical protein